MQVMTSVDSIIDFYSIRWKIFKLSKLQFRVDFLHLTISKIYYSSRRKLSWFPLNKLETVKTMMMMIFPTLREIYGEGVLNWNSRTFGFSSFYLQNLLRQRESTICWNDIKNAWNYLQLWNLLHLTGKLSPAWAENYKQRFSGEKRRVKISAQFKQSCLIKFCKLHTRAQHAISLHLEKPSRFPAWRYNLHALYFTFPQSSRYKNGRNALFVCGFYSPSSHLQINFAYAQGKYCGKLNSVGREAKTANIHTKKLLHNVPFVGWCGRTFSELVHFFCRNVYPFSYLHEICTATYPHANSSYEQIQQVKLYKQAMQCKLESDHIELASYRTVVWARSSL